MWGWRSKLGSKKIYGINLKRDCTKRECQFNVPGNVKKFQQRYKHPTPDKPRRTLDDCTTPNCGQNQKHVKEKTVIKKLLTEGTRRMQEIIGFYLCYCRSTQHTPLVALISSSSQQSKAADDTNKTIKRCLDYLINFSNRTVTYAASERVLWVHSDGSCLEDDRANIRVGIHYFISYLIKVIDKSQPKLN